MSDYSKLVKALRCNALSKQCDSCKYGYHLCPDSECNDACNVEQVYADAAAAIEALQAQLPKRGEWELIDGAEPMRWGCSRCKYMSWDTSNYCPRCGAKMGVRDADE